jgi:ATP-dependent RNA helicase DeaD
LRRARSLLDRARVKYRIEPIPTASAICEAQDARWLSELLNAGDGDVPARIAKLIEQIVAAGMTERALAQLIVSVRRATGEPRDVSQLMPEQPRDRRADQRGHERPGDRRTSERRERFDAPRGRGPEPRFSRDRERHSEAPPASWTPGPPERAERGASEGWVPFRVSWGEAHGADARRLVAMLCRRGNVRGSDIGAIRVDRTSSTVEVAATVAKDFERAAAEPDPRDFRVLITPLGAEAPQARSFDEAPRAPHKPRAHVPPSQHRGPPPQSAFPHRPFPPRDVPPPRPFPHRAPAPSAAQADGERPHAKPEPARSHTKPRGERPFTKPHGAAPHKKALGPAAAAPPKKSARRVIVDAPPRRQRSKG